MSARLRLQQLQLTLLMRRLQYELFAPLQKQRVSLDIAFSVLYAIGAEQVPGAESMEVSG